MLKFMSEFALNKTQRLTFDSSSPNGILLFREVSKVNLLAHRTARRCSLRCQSASWMEQFLALFTLSKPEWHWPFVNLLI